MIRIRRIRSSRGALVESVDSLVTQPMPATKDDLLEEIERKLRLTRILLSLLLVAIGFAGGIWLSAYITRP